jgi:cytochrome c biogenesis protein CcdA
MTHLPFVAAAYTLGVALPVLLAIKSLMRLRFARRRLQAIDPRRGNR